MIPLFPLALTPPPPTALRYLDLPLFTFIYSLSLYCLSCFLFTFSYSSLYISPSSYRICILHLFLSSFTHTVSACYLLFGLPSFYSAVSSLPHSLFICYLHFCLPLLIPHLHAISFFLSSSPFALLCLFPSPFLVCVLSFRVCFPC